MDSSLNDLFRAERGQTLEETKPNSKEEVYRIRPDTSIFHPRGVEKPRERRNQPGDKYQSFLDKYNDLERFIDGFDAMDLTYYFREVSRDCGYKYVISNKMRDVGVFKKALKNFSARELCLMIEFLFSDETIVEDRNVLQPTILSSNAVNTIYPASQQWAKGEKITYSLSGRSKAKLTLKKREWKNTEPQKEKSKIGEW